MTEHYLEDSEQGMIKLRTTTLNQADEPVQALVASLVVPRRAMAATAQKESVR